MTLGSPNRTPAAQRFVVIDFETTGFHPNQGHRVIEIGAVEVVNDEIGDSYQTLINPGIKIPEGAINVHKITDQMVLDAQTPSAAFTKLISFIGDSIIVAHNIQFESAFLTAECQRINQAPPLKTLCTLMAANKLYPNLPRHTLGYLIEHLKIKPKGPLHRALPDAQCTAELLLIMRKADRSGKIIP